MSGWVRVRCVGVPVRLQQCASVVSCRPGVLQEEVAARISQMRVRIWCTSWSVLGSGYFSRWLRPMRRRTLWMGWYPQVRGCCGLGGGFLPCEGPASTCVWVLGMAQNQG